MAGQLAGFATHLSPGKWESDPASPEENLRTFNEWVEEFERWIDICGMGLNIQQKWALMIATGREDMKDLMLHQAGIQVKQRERVNFVQGVPYQPAVQPDANGQGGRGAIEEVIQIEAQEPLIPTTWETGIALCKRAITKFANQITARNRLFKQMPADSFTTWRKWTIELLEQAKRCRWDDYGAEAAALDRSL